MRSATRVEPVVLLLERLGRDLAVMRERHFSRRREISNRPETYFRSISVCRARPVTETASFERPSARDHPDGRPCSTAGMRPAQTRAGSAIRGGAWNNPDVAQTMLAGTYMGGHPAIDKPQPGSLLKIDDLGVQLLGGFGGRNLLLSMPWDKVTALSAEGPDQVQTRFTATRFALMGPFALASRRTRSRIASSSSSRSRVSSCFRSARSPSKSCVQPSHHGLAALKARWLRRPSRYKVGKRAITETSAFASSRI